MKERKETDDNQTHMDILNFLLTLGCYTVGVVESIINLNTRERVTYLLHMCERVVYPQTIRMSRTERIVKTHTHTHTQQQRQRQQGQQKPKNNKRTYQNNTK